MNLSSYPTVVKIRKRSSAPALARETDMERPLDVAWLRRLCLDAGADDVGFVAVDRPEIADQRDVAPRARSSCSVLFGAVYRGERHLVRLDGV
ncbi:MAG: hypothetical protein MJE77_45005 [Proteobacteria bacterium]|nr:hypothetical protein [Pseudomonadota bacterium]